MFVCAFKTYLKLNINGLFIAAFVIFISILLLTDYIEEEQTEPHSEYPTIIWWSSSAEISPIKPKYFVNQTIKCLNKKICDVVYYASGYDPRKAGAHIFVGSLIDFSILPPRKPNDLWALFNDESPKFQPALLHEGVLNNFNFSGTFSRYSDFPYPLQYMGPLENITSKEYYIETKSKNLLLKEIAPILFLQSFCETSTNRDEYVRALMNYIRIDSYGPCVKNKQLPNSLKNTDFYNDGVLRFIARYKFIIAIENSICDDYITEKFWRAIAVGTVPIYFGSPTIRDWMPNYNSAVLLKDFPTPKLLSKHLKKLLLHDQLYETYLEHKTKGIIRNKNLIAEYEARPRQINKLRSNNLFLGFQCFICKKLHEKQKKTLKIVTKSHLNCPKPVSALSLGFNYSNIFTELFEQTMKNLLNETLEINK